MHLAWTAFSLLLPIAFSCLSIQVPLSTLTILPRDMAIKETIPPGCDVFLPLCHWRLAGFQAGGVGQRIGNVLYAPCMGLACIPITAWRASVAPRAENIWKHSQSKHNLGQVPDWRENKPGSPGSQQSEVHWGTLGTYLWYLGSSLSMWWECCGVKIHTCLLTQRCVSLPSPEIPLLSAKGLTHGLLSFCPQQGLGVPVSNSILAPFKPWSFPAFQDWSPVSLDHAFQCILGALRDHTAPPRHGQALLLPGEECSL